MLKYLQQQEQKQTVIKQYLYIYQNKVGCKGDSLFTAVTSENGLNELQL